MTTIPYARQDIDENDIAAVVGALRSDWLTQGPAVERFETAAAAYCLAGHAVAMATATAALHLACRAVGLGPGDTLWTSPNTFVASANAALYCGAEVDFVDIDPSTYNMSVDVLASRLAQAEQEGRLPAVVMPVHFAGQPCDMAAIAALAQRYGFRVIEDASHAIGACYADGAMVGSGVYSDICVFSFHPVKIITTGEGGMAVTNDPELAAKLRLLRTHGITRDPALMRHVPDGGWYYEQIDLGFNYRITDLQAALGNSQLSRIEGFLARRDSLAAKYASRLGGLGIGLPTVAFGARSAWHLYVIQVDETVSGVTRRVVYDRLRAGGIQCNVHYIPVHRQPYYEAMGFRQGQFPNAERYYARALSLPLFTSLSESDHDRICDRLGEILGAEPARSGTA